ncbi:AIM18 [Candida oxycetoniae]|uniref:Altered inheritance of mitochondria protein 18, mitochondrial n=1 Tax=Candida oxycetoniae TaxID=497107 RepID=A0AAI9WWL9_9ASCO|nr:AIM18 [Candida oxycetoniae]KAI3402874.2 AIM18 [Candida oxycetoniae]
MFRTLRTKPLRGLFPAVALTSTLAAAAASYHIYNRNTFYTNDIITDFRNNGIFNLPFSSKKILLDSSIAANEVKVDDSISPFPTRIPKSSNVSQNFALLGHGVRSVTFVSFKVYGIAIYIAESDIPQAREILRSYAKAHPSPPSPAPTPSDTASSLVQSSLTESLANPVHSEEVVSLLLSHNIRFLLRLSPVRNTDFNHLKDGLIKSILAHSTIKEASEEKKQELSKGLDELRDCFGKTRGSVPKDDLLVMEQLQNGELAIAYVGHKKKKDKDGNEEKEKDKNSLIVRKMGIVHEPLVARTLLLSYLSGKKPLSDSLKKSCMDGLVEIGEK